MKKLFGFIIILLLVLIALIYWSVSGSDSDLKTAEIINYEEVESIDFKKHDSILIAASTLFEGGAIKKLMQGETYRKAWSTPVKFPVVYLDTLYGGMEIVEEGGGRQTHSLEIKSPDGTVYSLRSINKDPKKLIPEIAEKLGLENVIVDGLSAQHPYGAVLAAEMADIAGVLHTHPKPVFLPKQERLGKFNKKFGNRIFLLEYETKGDVNWTPYNADKILDTDGLQELKMKKGDKVSIDHKALVRARLFDLLIGDWDRHAKQWGWVMQKENGGFKAVPLAGDRDNAFFKPGGVIPEIVTNKNIKPLIRPFEKDIDFMPGLVYPFDIYFLRSVPETVFVEQAKILQTKLTDKKLEESFKVWPASISKLDKNDILTKVKNRREHLVEYAREFHKIINERDLLSKPLKGSEDLKLNEKLLKCFDCE
ncbi:hypothetical protein [Salegentibacter chungangensis]|uniref:Uncharacterized protein n=1 Tax=Salegentibacter chungangensis TaxID=1335724 RepID=A0ABW3NNY2_9FLAO